MKILLTGATGFIGSHLLKMLISKKYEVVALRRNSSKSQQCASDTPRFRWHEIDDKLSELFACEGFDAVVHLATVYGRKGEAIESLVDANVIFPLRLLQYSCQFGCRKFLHTDTFYTKFDHQYDYLREYILSKKQLVEWCHVFARNHPEVNLYNVRLEHVYGPLDGPDKFIPQIIRKFKCNKHSIDLTSGEQLRDFIFVNDVAEAYMALLELNDSKSGYQEVGVGTGISFSVRNVVEKIKMLTQSSSLLNFGAIPQRKGEIMESLADNSFLSRIHWKPRINIEDGLLQTIKSI